MLDIFTFHYVSIKSLGVESMNLELIKFTFHYVSIKSIRQDITTREILDLHSTMYLLNR